ncbi:hypothetical protein HRM2_35630 [Desulforapulum autotrophicum HRM2]|uniref:Uncharacterized protein n=1 Tax=Desulforapulum autotrophicum (strain ATCC 43914 / DSM 3382 / VKM B-1955 / HRM2) TaxID=177437 RepID=C0Q9C3_DESAH|nr:hypothetical protein HRM2_35630 [Desulforapulum autotrophicum HRM2]
MIFLISMISSLVVWSLVLMVYVIMTNGLTAIVSVFPQEKNLDPYRRRDDKGKHCFVCWVPLKEILKPEGVFA